MGRDSGKSATPTTRANDTALTSSKSRRATVIAADYNGLAVSFTGDGWFNATAAAKHYGKRIPHWLENAETQQYMNALAEALNIRNSGYLIRTQRGRDGGTWLHPKLAVAFARWCDARFAVWCDLQIDHILRGGLSVWRKAGGERSDTTDREPLLTAAAAIVARHRLPFGTVYEALNTFAGVAHAREMSCDQVVESAEFGARLLAGNATRDDFAQIEQHRAKLGKAATQLSLLGGAQ
ncbi:KilA-N domain-containing protein [Burkholderia vietnamiensis]|nr:KilA-N domain-containing protein [Burkholderia vietnamiensis]